MADNIATTPGVGAIVRTDDVGGVQLQVIKLALGQDGMEDGLVSDAYPLPISLRDATTGIAATVQAVQQTPGGNALRVQVGPGDVISNIPVVLEYDHHQVHEGESYCYTWVSTAQNGNKDFRIIVPDVPATLNTPHIVVEVMSDSTLTRIYWYEGTTWTSAGQDDSANIFNRNRNVLTPAGTQIYISGTPALTPNALGTNFYQDILFSAKAGTVSQNRSMAEWDLKRNTEYLFRINTAALSNALVRFLFYEDRGV